MFSATFLTMSTYGLHQRKDFKAYINVGVNADDIDVLNCFVKHNQLLPLDRCLQIDAVKFKRSSTIELLLKTEHFCG